MKKTLLLAAAVICAAFLLVSCDKLSGGNGNSNGNSNTGNKNSGTTASSGGDIGVPECDAYLKKYEACINDKVPEAGRTSFKQSMDAARKSYKDAAANPQTKAALAQSCTSAEEATKKALASYNCNW